jgi:hypothetical protein
VVPIQTILLLKQNERDIELNQEVVSFISSLCEFWTGRFGDQTHTMEIVQKTISVPALSRGCNLISDKILSKLPKLHQFSVGLMNIPAAHERHSEKQIAQYDWWKTEF